MHGATLKSIARHNKAGVHIGRIAADRGISIEMVVAALVDAGLVRIQRFNQVVGRAKRRDRQRAIGRERDSATKVVEAHEARRPIVL